MGGHNIPPEVVRRRFEAGRRNFFDLYVPLAEIWNVYDNSGESEPRLIAFGGRQKATVVVESDVWEAFSEGQK